MGKDCCAPEISTSSSQGWIRALKIALILNLAMFAVEMVASWRSGSMSLRADAMDFLGDAFNYGISLIVASAALVIRARVSLLKGATMTVFGLVILVQTGFKIFEGGLPETPTMGIVGTLAFLTNFICAVLLFKFRDGDSNMRSVWLCTRNDMIGNLMVLAAAGFVFWLQSGWPDWIVSLILAGLGIQSGLHVIRLAREEIRHPGTQDLDDHGHGHRHGQDHA